MPASHLGPSLFNPEPLLFASTPAPTQPSLAQLKASSLSPSSGPNRSHPQALCLPAAPALSGSPTGSSSGHTEPDHRLLTPSLALFALPSHSSSCTAAVPPNGTVAVAPDSSLLSPSLPFRLLLSQHLSQTGVPCSKSFSGSHFAQNNGLAASSKALPTLTQPPVSLRPCSPGSSSSYLTAQGHTTGLSLGSVTPALSPCTPLSLLLRCFSCVSISFLAASHLTLFIVSLAILSLPRRGGWS